MSDANRTQTSKEQQMNDVFGAKNAKHLQMCGGEVKIVDKKEESVLRFGSSGGSIVSISSSSESEPSPLRCVDSFSDYLST